ncbi:MAG: hypothetical protein R3C26_02735 [Calditrichia bacterium]
MIDYCGPEFESFIRKYIIGNAPLPYAEMLEKVGINYIESKLSEPVENDFGFFTGRMSAVFASCGSMTNWRIDVQKMTCCWLSPIGV